MILLLGGTSDTAPIATALAKRGHRVLVSKATSIPLAIGDDPRVESRSVPLDEAALAQLIRQRAIHAIIDATHPYAVTILARAYRVAQALAIPHLTFVRPPSIAADTPDVDFAPHHAEAARRAFAHRRPVLLTIGSRHLEPYVREAARTGGSMVARVLDDAASRAACRAVGLSDACVLVGRGVSSLEANRQQIWALDAGVLVTKDSGLAGGTLEKLAAARVEDCRVVVLARPAPPGTPLGSIDALVDALTRVVERR
jgi:precorrin-6A/cobalt-precorrin-6A reductase